MTNRTRMLGVAGTTLAVIFAGIFSIAAIAQKKTAPPKTNSVAIEAACSHEVNLNTLETDVHMKTE